MNATCCSALSLGDIPESLTAESSLAEIASTLSLIEPEDMSEAATDEDWLRMLLTAEQFERIQMVQRCLKGLPLHHRCCHRQLAPLDQYPDAEKV